MLSQIKGLFARFISQISEDLSEHRDRYGARAGTGPVPGPVPVRWHPTAGTRQPPTRGDAVREMTELVEIQSAPNLAKVASVCELLAGLARRGASATGR